ncbi:MAG: hypothetical protein V9G19_24615 [Tetrasphaera sp.]
MEPAGGFHPAARRLRGVVWSFQLDPDEAGTRLTQRRETPDGISQRSLDYTERYLGGQERFTAELRAGMRATLVAIKDAAEAEGQRTGPAGSRPAPGG